MNNAIKTGARANLLGGLWMVASMGAFAVEDALIKATAAELPLGQILILFGLGGALVFAGVARFRSEPLFVSDVLSPPMLLRAVFEIVGRLLYFLAVALIPLSTATVILQATPLVVVASAALLFGEQVGWRRWVAIGIGLTGVIVIVRPGVTGFSALSLLAVMGMLGFAGRDLASRMAPPTISTTLLGLYGFLSIMLAGSVHALWQGAPFILPDTRSTGLLISALTAGVLAYACLMKAMRTGEVSAVTPFRYTRLLFGIAMGVLFFGEGLSASMLIGSGLIVLSGLFILWRQRSVTVPQ